jgi:hypothetical protein
MELVTSNITSLPWPLKSSTDFAEPPAHYRRRKWLIACDHMSGLLLRSHVTAGQDGIRDGGSKQGGDL